MIRFDNSLKFYVLKITKLSIIKNTKFIQLKNKYSLQQNFVNIVQNDHTYMLKIFKFQQFYE